MTPAANETLRCFVAVAISPETRGFLERFMREARGAFSSYRFASTENLHITLQFLGDVDRSRVPELAEALTSAVRGLRKFSAGLGEAGSFPSRDTPRILHVAVGQGQAELSRLAGGVVAALSPLGFRPDKPFMSHITLGRARDRDRQAALGGDVAASWRAAFSQFMERAKGPIDWEIPEVILMESVLGAKGPIYIRRGTAPLSQ